MSRQSERSEGSGWRESPVAAEPTAPGGRRRGTSWGVILMESFSSTIGGRNFIFVVALVSAAG